MHANSNLKNLLSTPHWINIYSFFLLFNIIYHSISAAVFIQGDVKRPAWKGVVIFFGPSETKLKVSFQIFSLQRNKIPRIFFLKERFAEMGDPRGLGQISCYPMGFTCIYSKTHKYSHFQANHCCTWLKHAWLWSHIHGINHRTWSKPSQSYTPHLELVGKTGNC